MIEVKPVVQFACPMFRMDIGKSQCQTQSSIISKNETVCTAQKCKSPWRLCISCLKQGYKGYGNTVIPPKHKLCNFHMTHGPDAIRSHSGNDPLLSQIPASPIRRTIGLEVEVVVEVEESEATKKKNASLEKQGSRIEEDMNQLDSLRSYFMKKNNVED